MYQCGLKGKLPSVSILTGMYTDQGPFPDLLVDSEGPSSVLLYMTTTPKFHGYVDPSALPIKKGDTVTIKRGTMVKAFGKDPKPAGRTYKVKIDHVLPGQNDLSQDLRVQTPVKNPSVRWAGTGGLWMEVDINDIPEAQ